MFKIKVQVPSGKLYRIEELKNKSYFATNKFILNDDVYGCFQMLDEHLGKTIPEIESLTLLDKVALYLYLFATCVRAVITLPTESITELEAPRTIDLISVADSLSSFVKTQLEYTIQTNIGEVQLTIFYPTRLECIEGLAVFDPISAVRMIKVKDEIYKIETESDKEVLNTLLPADQYYALINFIIENFNVNVVFSPGSVEIPLLNPYFFKYLACNLFYSGIQYQFDMMYLLQKHLNLSINDYMSLSPADTDVIFSKLVKDKEDEKKAMSENTSKKTEIAF